MSIIPAIVLVIAGSLSYDAPLEARIVSNEACVMAKDMFLIPL